MTKPVVTIAYCPKCKWLLRAAYMAQEFLTTFEEELGGVTLQPGETAGIYRIYVNDQLLFDRKEYGGFADIRELKQWLRDRVRPGKDLGHTDKV
ncbi:SelT/SelW/SelH family protein [Sinomicrobium pectinilyticum]|uniref:SelT/SelW/SelH family protein n=1 Tax=Sinomicrobium pectinilyticum TaxID=1084421 RepID=A0A3N0DHM6_SINP1|nr:SelT/SelW/SelH family protein [Sinomicrobium pectinilyticum]RNL75187.1 SelT/SelW/SelH family protein [Sinomicrobium pectinilyticum]